MQKTVQKKDADNGGNLIGQFWFKFFPYWPLFLILLLLSVGGAWLYLRRATPLYETSASIMVKDESKGVEEGKMIEALNQASTTKIIENEMEVIKSKTLMLEVVKNLHLYAPVFEETKFRVKSAYTTSPIKVESANPDSLTEAEKVYFTYDPAKSEVILNGSRYPMNQFVKTAYGVLKFTPNQPTPTVPAEGPMYFALSKPLAVASGLTGRMEVAPVSKVASVIHLQLRDESPKRSEDILNELMNAYRRASLNEKNSLAANTLTFVEERLALVTQDLASIEQKLQAYKSKKGAIDISSQGRMFLSNISENDQKLGDVNMQLAVLGQVESYVKSKDKRGGIVPSTLGVSDPMLSELLNKLYQAELEYEKMKKTTGENSPLLVSVTDQIEKIKPSILENIQSQRRSLEASRNNLSSTNNYYASMLRTIPEKERELVEISRDQAIKNNIYNFLLQKREEAALSQSSTASDSRIIDRATSSLGPVAPDSKMIYLVSMVIALGLGVALVYGKEVMNRTILYRHEIEAITNIPIIGEIANEPSKEALAIGEGKRTFVAEQFRKLRVSLSYMGLGSSKKKILVTSTISGEGKSFIAANLGLSLALAGKRVVLVELDLSNPSLSDKLNFKAEKGVSNYLKGECEPLEIVNRTEAHENLFIIPSGPLPNNPSELLMNGELPSLFAYLDDLFDYVIVDSAPVGPVSDAYVLSPLCDATLFVIRHRHTPKALVQRLDENNKVNELKNIAIVFNGIRPRGFRKDGYGYGYGYGYGHVYQTKEKKVSS